MKVQARQWQRMRGYSGLRRKLQDSKTTSQKANKKEYESPATLRAKS